jgi:hypothetical protein
MGQKQTQQAPVDLVRFGVESGNRPVRSFANQIANQLRIITGRDDRGQNAEPSRTVSYRTAQVRTRSLELENRSTGNLTVGSNPTLSAN